MKVDPQALRDLAHEIAFDTDEANHESAVLVRAAADTIDALRAEVDDWRDSAKAAAGEMCGDERHCTCVGPLRAAVAAMNREFAMHMDMLVKCRGERDVARAEVARLRAIIDGKPDPMCETCGRSLDGSRPERVGYCQECCDEKHETGDRLSREVARLRDLLRRLREWDHMATAHDGPYWCREIDAALGEGTGAAGGRSPFPMPKLTSGYPVDADEAAALRRIVDRDSIDRGDP